MTDWSATETGDGVDVTLRYRLGDIDFVEHLALGVPAAMRVRELTSPQVRNAIALLHLTAGLSYFKAALPPAVHVRSTLGPATVGS